MPTPVGAEVAERRLDEEKFSLVAEGGTAILALSAGTLKRPRSDYRSTRSRAIPLAVRAGISSVWEIVSV